MAGRTRKKSHRTSVNAGKKAALTRSLKGNAKFAGQSTSKKTGYTYREWDVPLFNKKTLQDVIKRETVGRKKRDVTVWLQLVDKDDDSNKPRTRAFFSDDSLEEIGEAFDLMFDASGPTADEEDVGAYDIRLVFSFRKGTEGNLLRKKKHTSKAKQRKKKGRRK